MRIAVNTRWLISGKLEGTGWFTHSLLERVTKAHPEVEFHFLFDRPFGQEFIYGPNVKGHVVPPPARHPFLWYLWNDVAVPTFLKKIKPDLYISVDGFLPAKVDCKTISVIHDLNFEHHPQFVPRLVRAYYRKYMKRSAGIASSIMTVSQTSAQDIHDTYGIPQKHINVVYNAPQGQFAPLSAEEKEAQKKRLTQGKPYFIYIGAFSERKNLTRLIQAFDQMKTEKSTPHRLVLVGEYLHNLKAFDEALKKLKFREDVVFTGRLNGEQLRLALGGADGFAFPTLFEGFGIPAVEAFASGVQVMTSDVSCMPEVVGDAAILVDPYDQNSIAEGLHVMANNNVETEARIQKGLERAKLFNWDESAEKFWKAINDTMHGA